MKRFVLTVALAVALVMSACGGDNSRYDGDSGGEPGPPADVSLVPAPPTAGAVLYAKASELRPLRDGAAWTYRGHDFVAGTVFENVVRQEGSASAVTETHSRDTAMHLTYSLSATGDVMQSGTITLPWSGKALQIDAVELHSPVRLNEQSTLFDGVVDDIGVDLDADGVRDGARVGVYSRVVGNEDVTLPDRVPLRALRVDTHVAVAPRLSGGGPAAGTERVLSTWYAPGIGPVRAALRSTVAGREFDEDEVLIVWDGITEGLGYLVQAHVFPPGTDALAGTPVPPQILSMALEDGALVLTEAGEGYAMHRFDLRGTLVATHLYPAGPPFTRAFKLLRLRSGPRMASYSDTGIELYAFTESGERADDPPVASFPGYQHSIAAVAGGEAVWLDRMVFEPPDDFLSDNTFVLLQRFTEDGRPLTEPVVISTYFSFEPLDTYTDWGVLVASGSAAVLSWSVPYGGRHTAMATNEGAGLLVRPYIPDAYPRAISDGTSLWVGWGWKWPNYSLHGARLAADGTLMLDSSGDVSAQNIVALGGSSFLRPWDESFVALDGHLVGIDFTFAEKFWPEEATTSNWMTLRDLDATADVLSTGAKLVAQVRVPLETFGPVSPLLFPDRALLIGDKGGQLQTIVVWRR